MYGHENSNEYLRIIGSGMGDKYSDSNVRRISVEELLARTNNAIGQFDLDGDFWIRADKNIGDLIRLSSNSNRMVKSVPSYNGLSIGGSISTGSHGNFSQDGTMSSEIDSAIFLNGNLDLIKIDKTTPLFNSISCNLGLGGGLIFVKIRTYTCENYSLELRIIDKEYLLENLEKIRNENLSFFINIYLRKGKPIIFLFTLKATHPQIGLNRGLDISIMSKLEELGIRFQHFIPNELKKELRYQLTKYKKPSYHYFGNDVHQTLRVSNENVRAMQQSDFISHEVCFDFNKSKIILESLLEELPNFWKNNKSSFPVNIRYSGSDRAYMSPAFGRDSLWIDFVTLRSKNYDLLGNAQNWHLANGFRGRPHMGKWFSNERYDLSKLYPCLKDFKNDINNLDPFGRFSSTISNLINDY